MGPSDECLSCRLFTCKRCRAGAGPSSERPARVSATRAQALQPKRSSSSSIEYSFTRHGHAKEASPFEQRVDALLRPRGLKAIWDYDYTWGNCWYDAVAHLSGTLGHSDGDLQPLTGNDVRREALVYLQSDAKGLSNFNKPDLETRLTTSYPTKLGGWPNPEIYHLVAQSLKISVVSHNLDGDVLLPPRWLSGSTWNKDVRPWPQYDLIWYTVPMSAEVVTAAGLTPNVVGHFVPCSRIKGWQPYVWPPTCGKEEVDLTECKD